MAHTDVPRMRSSKNIQTWSVFIEKPMAQGLSGTPKSRKAQTDWWFGTFVIFHNIWDNPSHWLIFFRGVGIPPTSKYLLNGSYLRVMSKQKGSELGKPGWIEIVEIYIWLLRYPDLGLLPQWMLTGKLPGLWPSLQRKSDFVWCQPSSSNIKLLHFFVTDFMQKMFFLPWRASQLVSRWVGSHMIPQFTWLCVQI